MLDSIAVSLLWSLLAIKALVLVSNWIFERIASSFFIKLINNPGELITTGAQM